MQCIPCECEKKERCRQKGTKKRKEGKKGRSFACLGQDDVLLEVFGELLVELLRLEPRLGEEAGLVAVFEEGSEGKEGISITRLC
jgi:hypothetical protein